MSGSAISSHQQAEESFAPVATKRTTASQLVLLFVVLAVFLVAEIHNARLRPLWFDELATLFVSSQPTFRGMFHAMLADGNPPLYFLLVRLCLHLPLNTELAVRLPSVLAFPATGLAVFLFVRRITSYRFGMLSMSTFLGSQIGGNYAVEGRAYSLLLLFTALLICLWHSARTDNRPWILPGIALCTSCAILTHQYGIVYATLPIATGEITRWIFRKQIDAAVLMWLGLGSLTILATYPPMLHAQSLLLSAIRSPALFSDRPSAGDLGRYWEMWPPFNWTLGACVVLVWVILSGALPAVKAVPSPKFSVPPEDMAVADILTMILPIILILTHLGTRFFMPRYAIGSALGIAILLGIVSAYASARWPPVNRLVSVMIVYCVATGALLLWLRAKPKPPIDHGASLFATVPGSEPIVVTSALSFVPSWWYTDPATRHRLHYLSDLETARTIPGRVPEYSLYLDRHQTPMQMDGYGSFIRSHREFLLYSPGTPQMEWIQSRLWREGWDIELIASNKRGKLFRATAPHARRTP